MPRARRSSAMYCSPKHLANLLKEKTNVSDHDTPLTFLRPPPDRVKNRTSLLRRRRSPTTPQGRSWATAATGSLEGESLAVPCFSRAVFVVVLLAVEMYVCTHGYKAVENTGVVFVGAYLKTVALSASCFFSFILLCEFLRWRVRKRLHFLREEERTKGKRQS